MKIKKKTKIIKNIINHFGYSLNNLDIIIEKDEFINKLDTISNIIENKQFELLFGKFNKNIKNNTRAFIGYLNSLLHKWKLCIQCVDKNKYDKKTKKNYHIYSYQLQNYNK